MKTKGVSDALIGRLDGRGEKGEMRRLLPRARHTSIGARA